MITSRRTFLKTAALSGASLVIGFDGRRLLQATNASAVGLFKPNGWVCINSDGTVILTIGKCEMGQGVRTSLAMILAEELEADGLRHVAKGGDQQAEVGIGGRLDVDVELAAGHGARAADQRLHGARHAARGEVGHGDRNDHRRGHTVESRSRHLQSTARCN